MIHRPPFSYHPFGNLSHIKDTSFQRVECIGICAAFLQLKAIQFSFLTFSVIVFIIIFVSLSKDDPGYKFLLESLLKDLLLCFRIIINKAIFKDMLKSSCLQKSPQILNPLSYFPLIPPVPVSF